MINVAEKIREYQRWSERFETSPEYNADADDRLSDLHDEIQDWMFDVGILHYTDYTLAPQFTAESLEPLLERVDGLGLNPIDALVVKNYIADNWEEGLRIARIYEEEGGSLLEIAIAEDFKVELIQRAIKEAKCVERPDPALCTVLVGDYPGAETEITLRRPDRSIMAIYTLKEDGQLVLQ
jgi:hypothetical protein